MFADSWRGLESTKSGAVTIGAATLTLDQSTMNLADFNGGLDDATLTGSLSGFASGEGIAFKLDDPSTGTTLSGTPANADSGGDATVSIALPRPTDGSHTIYAVGDAAYASQASASVLVDTTPPTSSASGTNSDWHNADVTVALSATDAIGGLGVKNVKYQVDGGSVQTISGAGGDVTIQAPANGSNDGTHTIAFYATDNAGNVEAPANSVTVKIDTTAPSTSLATSPASPDGDNGWFKQGSVQFTLGGTDASSGIAHSYYTIDGGSQTLYTGAVTIATPGDHTRHVLVDRQRRRYRGREHGARQARQREAVDVAGDEPGEPGRDNNWFKHTSVDFTLSASDGNSGVAQSFYTIDGGGAQTYTGAVTVGQGDHTVTYWSVDNAGNVEDVHATHVKVDDVRPSTSLATSPVSPDGDNGWFKQGSVQFTLSGSDAVSGVATTKYQIDGGAVQTYSSAVTISTQGDHTVTYWSVDNAGNVEDANTAHVKLDNVKPSTSLATTPLTPDGTNNWFTQATVSFTLSGSDATSGVAHSYYTVDGGAQTAYTGSVAIGQGDHTVTFWSVDNAGNVEDANTTHIKVDNVKPSTSISFSPSSPDGSNGWRVSATTFTLSGSDATSAVSTTRYQIDSGAVTTYPGSAVSVPQGQHTRQLLVGRQRRQHRDRADLGDDQGRHDESVDVDHACAGVTERHERLVQDDADLHARLVGHTLGRRNLEVSDRQRHRDDVSGERCLDPRRPAHGQLLVGRQRRQHRELEHDGDDQGRYERAVGADPHVRLVHQCELDRIDSLLPAGCVERVVHRHRELHRQRLGHLQLPVPGLPRRVGPRLRARWV